MKYIVGLGNPGSGYESTKHNVGFMVVNILAKEEGIDISEERYKSLLGKGRLEGERVTLVLPQTFMNLSGKSVKELYDEQMKAKDELIVISDDINLKLGRIRIKQKGSAGGHNGLESIIVSLKDNEFTRLRVGIATDIHKGDISDYVLAPFKRKDHKHVQQVVALAAEAVRFWVTNGTAKTMTRFNARKIGMS